MATVKISDECNAFITYIATYTRKTKKDVAVALIQYVGSNASALNTVKEQLMGRLQTDPVFTNPSC